MAHLKIQRLTRKSSLIVLRVALAAGVVTCLTVGCESQAPYAACGLDEEVTSKNVCNGDNTSATGTTSCVVRRHPHCAQSICLSYFSTTPVCTHTCDLKKIDADCEQGGFCWPFSDTESYCVPSDRKTVAGS